MEVSPIQNANATAFNKQCKTPHARLVDPMKVPLTANNLTRQFPVQVKTSS